MSKKSNTSTKSIYSDHLQPLNPKVDSPSFFATVPLQHYQVDPVHQPLGLSRLSTLFGPDFQIEEEGDAFHDTEYPCLKPCCH